MLANEVMTPLIPENNESAFQHVKRIMNQPIDISYNAPWSDDEWEAYVRQEPLPQNQSFQLPSEETNDPNQLQLI